MSVKPYNPVAIREIIELYRDTYPEIPTKNEQIYISDEAIQWDGYIEPVENLNKMFSDTFRFSENKVETDIRSAQEIGGTDNLCIEKIAYFVTDILVNEKYHGGLFALMIKNGVIDRVITRMECLLTEEEKFLYPDVPQEAQVEGEKPWWRFWQ